VQARCTALTRSCTPSSGPSYWQQTSPCSTATCPSHRQATQALDSMQRQLAMRQSRGSSQQQQQQQQRVSLADMALGFSAIWNLDTQQAAEGGQLQLPLGFRPKAMQESTSNTMIRHDMQQPNGITVWEFIQSAAALGLCPQRAKCMWFDSRLPSMQQAVLKKRKLDQA
jgi:hypothetical protein